jgi:hypothetical protein
LEPSTIRSHFHWISISVLRLYSTNMYLVSGIMPKGKCSHKWSRPSLSSWD